MMDRYSKLATVGDFVKWYNSTHSRQIAAKAINDFEAATMVGCDTAIMHGPGHQSTSECIVTTPGHTTHYSSMGHEWTDKDITDQTHVKYRYDLPPGTEPGAFVLMKDHIKTPIKTYRLASEPY